VTQPSHRKAKLFRGFIRSEESETPCQWGHVFFHDSTVPNPMAYLIDTK
jgi:hypothetical protein